jgi:Flp pilus assembly protein TadG
VTRRRDEAGQAAVELALCLPLVAALALVLLQVTLVVRDQVLLTHAAREAAREAAVSADAAAARRAAAAGAHLDPDRLAVVVRGRGRPGSRVTVVVRYRSPTAVPLVGSLVGDVHLSSTATMRVET